MGEVDGADSSEENMGKGTAGDGGFQGVGGSDPISHLHIFAKCIINRCILLSYPIANYCAHDSELPICSGKSK